jgi:hypothetical protein
MAATFTCARINTSTNYIPFVYGTMEKQWTMNEPSLLNFSLVPYPIYTLGSWTTNFVMLHRGDYITVNTTAYSKWFTGYITSEPDFEYFGKDSISKQPVYGYRYSATSDDYLLSLKTIGLLPPYINMYMGDILKDLINKLCPSKFTVTDIDDGLLLPYYVVDPTKTFNDVLKEFCERAYYIYWARDYAIHFKQQDLVTPTLAINGSNKHFTPSRFSIHPASDPIVNDVVVFGDVEPQGFIKEYFVGDGYTAQFPLMASIYGVEKSVILDDTFEGTDIDTSKWIEIGDPLDQYIQVSEGYLNVLGGNGDWDDVYLTSAVPIPLEGHLRLTHGEFDFVHSSTGMIASLWLGPPNSAFSGCLFGIQCAPTTGDATILTPVYNGVADPTVSFTARPTKRYIIRTIFSEHELIRATAYRAAIRSDGVVAYYGGLNKPTQYSLNTCITEIDITTGEYSVPYNWNSPAFGLSDSQLAAVYTPVIANDLHITVSNITISVPMQASLEIFPATQWKQRLGKYDALTGDPIVFDLTASNESYGISPDRSGQMWHAQVIGPNEIDCGDGMAPVATITTTNQGKIEQGNTLGTPRYNPGNATLQFFKDSVKQRDTIPKAGDLVRVTYRKAGVAVGRAINSTSITSEASVFGDDGVRRLVKSDYDPLPRTSEECEVLAMALATEESYQHYEGTYTQFSKYEFTGEPIPGMILQFSNMSAVYPSFTSEMIQEVTTTFEDYGVDIPAASPPRLREELFSHTVKFGRFDKLKSLLKNITKTQKPYTAVDTVVVPNAVDVAAASTTTTADSILWSDVNLVLSGRGTTTYYPSTALDYVKTLDIISWDSSPWTPLANKYHWKVNESYPSGGGWEFRSFDVGWGNDNNKSLIYKGTTGTLDTVRNKKGKYVFVKAYDATGKYSRFPSAVHAEWPDIPLRCTGLKGNGGYGSQPVFKAVLPTEDMTEDGTPLLATSIWGVEAMHAVLEGVAVDNSESLIPGWSTQNNSSLTVTNPIGVDNPGGYMTPEIGTNYPCMTLVLTANPTNLPAAGYAYMDSHIPAEIGVKYVFFIWVKGSAGDIIRLNIKDTGNGGHTFFSRSDFTLDGTWQAIYTLATIPSSATGNINVVIHNIGNSTATIKVCLPFVCKIFYDYGDLSISGSNDAPGLKFSYDNSLLKEKKIPLGILFRNTLDERSLLAIEAEAPIYSNDDTRAFVFYMAGPTIVKENVSAELVAPLDCTLTKWKVSSKTAATGANIITDIRRTYVDDLGDPATSSIFSVSPTDTRPTILAGSLEGIGYDFTMEEIVAGDKLVLDIEQAATSGGEDLTFSLFFHPTIV